MYKIFTNTHFHEIELFKKFFYFNQRVQYRKYLVMAMVLQEQPLLYPSESETGLVSCVLEIRASTVLSETSVSSVSSLGFLARGSGSSAVLEVSSEDPGAGISESTSKSKGLARTVKSSSGPKLEYPDQLCSGSA